jgi:hypothetical protein
MLKGLIFTLFPTLLQLTAVSQSLPMETTVKLIALSPISSATLQPGAKVQFRVSRNVIVSGSVVIPAGTAVEAVVRSVNHASKEHHRNGDVRLQLQDIDSGGYRIRLTMDDNFAPVNAMHRHSKFRDVAEAAAAGALVIALAPIVIPMGVAMTTSTGKPKGDELELTPCFHAEVFVRSARMLSGAPTQPSLAAADMGAVGLCADSTESLKFDGPFLDAVSQKRLRID